MKYTTVLLDVDNTLLDFSMCERVAVGTVMQHNGIEPTNENILHYSAVNDCFWKRFERGEIEKSEIYDGRFKTFLYEIGSQADADKISQEYIVELSEQCFVLDGAVELLKELSSECDIYYTTNGNAQTQYKRIKKSGIGKYAKGIFVSEAVGYKKPQQEYFRIVLDSIPEKDKSKIVVIGDSQSSDILGGINAGLDTVWYNPLGEKAEYPPTYTVSALSEISVIFKSTNVCK